MGPATSCSRRRRAVALRAGVVTLVAVTLPLLAACAAHSSRIVAADSSRDLLFGPLSPADGPPVVWRENWPSTSTTGGYGEVTSYTTLMIDTEARTHRGRAHLYRRFESVRTGRQLAE
jgi:hypothetical protein